MDKPIVCMLRWMLALGLGLAAATTLAATYPLPDPGQSVVGEIQVVPADGSETLLDIARRFDLGFNEISAANPDIDPWLPEHGQAVIVPTQFILPDGPREGIVINLPEMRLYYYPKPAPGQAPVVITHPLGIGAEGKAIPLAQTRVVGKAVDPPWVVPESVLAEHAAEGERLPKVVPPGPNNPLGRFAMRLGLTQYLIHGTNRPFGIGMRVSHGCLRMYPEDIESLYPKVPVGTRVSIVNIPFKAGWRGSELYFEAHVPMAEPGYAPASSTQTLMVTTLVGVTSGRLNDDAWQKAAGVVGQLQGVPTLIHQGALVEQPRQAEVPAPVALQPAKEAAQPAKVTAQSASEAAQPAKGTAQSAGQAALPAKGTAQSATGWMVQVGAFRDTQNAELLAGTVNRMQLAADAALLSAGRLCRVVVGPFPSREHAAEIEREISRLAGLSAYVFSVQDLAAVQACGPGAG